MEYTKHCRNCYCSKCRKQTTPDCPFYYDSRCEVCEGQPISRAARYAKKSWECKCYERKVESDVY